MLRTSRISNNARDRQVFAKTVQPTYKPDNYNGKRTSTHFSETLDGVLNNQYENIGAEVVFPPLALALNNQNESLTRKRKIQDFQE